MLAKVATPARLPGEGAKGGAGRHWEVHFPFEVIVMVLPSLAFGSNGNPYLHSRGSAIQNPHTEPT